MHRELREFVFRKVKDRALADDIVQEVFIKVQLKLGQLNDTQRLSGWIFQITRSTIIDHYRKKPKNISARDLDWESHRQDFNDCVAFCLRRLMFTLPLKYREALELTEIQSLSQVELAQRWNISHSGAKSRVQRARQMLREKMEELYFIKTDAYGNIIECEDRMPCDCHCQPEVTVNI
jgi:RNA polymerase sigma-70 factor (ECF subfamily)